MNEYFHSIGENAKGKILDIPNNKCISSSFPFGLSYVLRVFPECLKCARAIPTLEVGSTEERYDYC